MSTTLSLTEPIARKVHRCSWCGEIIPVKTRYSRWVGIFEGDFQSNKMYLECHKAQQKYTESWDDGLYAPHEHRRGSTHEKWCSCMECLAEQRAVLSHPETTPGNM